MNPWDALISSLNLMPHDEGGYFRETFRSAIESRLALDSEESRPLLTCIYYLLTSEAPLGRLHRNRSDIVHFFQGGGVLRYHMLGPDGVLASRLLGPDPRRGHQLQLVIPGGSWKATELMEGDFVLVGEAVAPGFDYRDRELACLETIKSMYPHCFDQLKKFMPVV